MEKSAQDHPFAPPTSDWQQSDSPKMPTKVCDLFVWKSLSHPENHYPKGAFTTIGTIGLLLSIIFSFFQEWFLIALTWATIFLVWALSKVVPEETEHRITTQGIISLGRSYLWAELGPFWFSDKKNHRMLHLAHGNVFGQLVMLIDKKDEEVIRDTLAQYLPFIEVWQKSTTEKMTDWFSKKFSMDKMLATKEHKTDKSDNSEKPDTIVKPEEPDKKEKADFSDKTEMTGKAEKTDLADLSDQPDITKKMAVSENADVASKAEETAKVEPKEESMKKTSETETVSETSSSISKPTLAQFHKSEEV